MAGGRRQKPGPSTLAFAEIVHLELQRHKRNRTMTQAELAQKLQVSEGQMSKMLNGHTAIDYDQAAQICKELGLDFLKVIAEAEKKARTLRLNL